MTAVLLPNLTALVGDASRYQALIKPKVLKAGRVVAEILKSSGGLNLDPRFNPHYDVCQEGELPTPVYHWVDPIISAEKQINFLLSVTEGKNIPFYVLDIEQWWNAWAAWYLAWAKKITWSLVPKIKPDLISKHAYQCWQLLKAKTRKPVVIYTSFGFVRSYAPQMAEWLDESEHNWPAAYLSYPQKITCSWTTFQQNYMPTGIATLLPDGMKPETVRGWQFTGDVFSLPGTYADTSGLKLSPADVSVFDPTWLNAVLEGQTPVDPKPTLKPFVVSAWVYRGLNLRAYPNTAAIVLKLLKAGSPLLWTGQASGDWLEVIADGITGWVHSSFVDQV